MTCRGPRENGKFMNGECQKCPVCGPGKGHSKRCKYGEGAGATCRPCIEGEEFSQDSECHACIKCASHNRKVKYKCRPRLNAKCGKCLPRYFNAYSFEGAKCTHCLFRPSHPHCSNYTRTVPSKAIPTEHPVSYAHIPSLSKDPSVYANNTSAEDTKYALTNGAIAGISTVGVILSVAFIAGFAYYCWRRRNRRQCCTRRHSITYIDGSRGDIKIEEVATDEKSQEMRQFLDTLPHTEREFVPRSYITGATKSVKDQNPKLRVILMEDGRQKAEPDICSSHDDVNRPIVAGRDAIDNNDTAPDGPTPAPPTCAGSRQNNVYSNNIPFGSRMIDMSSLVELDETEGAVRFSNGTLPSDPLMPRISRARNTHPAYRDAWRHEEALRKGSKIRVGNLPQDVLDALDMHLKETNVAGDKNYKHVADWLELSAVTPLIRNNLKCMKDVIKHMVNEEKKLDELMECLKGLNRHDALKVLEGYCLSVDVREDENDIDVGGPALQETGDHKREMAVPMSEASVTTKLLPG